MGRRVQEAKPELNLLFFGSERRNIDKASHLIPQVISKSSITYPRKDITEIEWVPDSLAKSSSFSLLFDA